MVQSNISYRPRIAVLLAAFNGMKWIKEQIESILNQQDVHVHIFISIDLSSDGTELWVEELAATEKRVEVLPYGAQFGSAGKNFFRLMADVKFDYFDAVALADQDDIWMPHKLKSAIATINKENVNATSSDVIAFWENGKRRVIKKSYPKRKFDHFFEAAGPGCTYVLECNSAKILQKFIQNNPEKIAKIMHHDWFIYAFYRGTGFKWCIDTNPTMLYRQHSNNQVGVNIGLKAYLERLKIVKNKEYRGQVEQIVKILAPSDAHSFQNYWFLLKNAYNFRRKFRDRIILFFLFLFKIY